MLVVQGPTLTLAVCPICRTRNMDHAERGGPTHLLRCGACGHRMTQLRVPGVPVEWLHAMGTDLSPLFRLDHPSAGVLGGEGVLA